MANTVSTVQLSLRKLTRKLAAKSALTNCCVPSTKSMYTGSTTLPDFFAGMSDDFTPPIFAGYCRDDSHGLRFRLYALQGARLV
nr:hypothetical protein [Escherichia coli]